MNQSQFFNDAEPSVCCFERCSSNSTCPEETELYHQTFFVGSIQKHENAVKLEVSGNVLSYYWNNNQYCIQLNLTVMEQQLYLRNHQAVFAIKLINNTATTVFSTFNRNHFVDIYCLLAKHCILTGFQKHFKVGQELGAGAFGKVYNGFNIISNQNVALKVIYKEELNRIKNGLTMLHNQIQALQKLRKFHISPLISTYQTVDCYILVLQKGNGENLMEFLKNQKPKKCQQFFRCILKQLLQFIRLMHRAGIIHRDIKPDNIICKQNKGIPSIFLSDYGLSIDKQQQQKQVNTCCGTLGFMAPQIINQEQFNQKCDMFSVGCLAYALSTGKKLFQTKSYFQLRMMVQNSDYVDQKLESLTGLDFQFRDLLHKMLQHSPEKRISANDALKHKYFKGCQSVVLNIGQVDFTLRSFIENKISKYWS